MNCCHIRKTLSLFLFHFFFSVHSIAQTEREKRVPKKAKSREIVPLSYGIENGNLIQFMSHEKLILLVRMHVYGGFHELLSALLRKISQNLSEFRRNSFVVQVLNFLKLYEIGWTPHGICHIKMFLL